MDRELNWRHMCHLDHIVVMACSARFNTRILVPPPYLTIIVSWQLTWYIHCEWLSLAGGYTIAL